MNIQKLSESLSQNERKIIPYLKEDITQICKKTNLDKVSVLRALEYLKNKGIIKLEYTKKKIIELGVNGILYKKRGLPERKLIDILDDKRILSLKDAKILSNLSEDEFKASIGALKKKAFIDMKNGKIILNANKEEISKKMLEELFLESLPIYENELKPEQKYALQALKKRRNIIEIKDKIEIIIKVTELGKKISNQELKQENMIEQITSEIIKKDSNWKNKKFRRYDVTSPVPEISGGKRHFVNQAIDYARKIWTEMGFKEMSGNYVVSSFWNFDALFTAQDHPVREMHDTFFLNRKTSLPDKKLVNEIKKAHETGTGGSSGWQYEWDEEKAKRLLIRTHTTCLSSQKLANLNKKELPQRFFSIGKCFRNETVDWKHGFEFNQTEGIVVDRNANFKHLLGYLKEFAKKMGFEKIRFRPAYFPYTEPSLEGDVWDEEKQEWVELIAAGIFRPEVTEPLLGEPIPVLAWGPGFDRMIMKVYEIKDLREMYKNNINKLRKMKYFPK